MLAEPDMTATLFNPADQTVIVALYAEMRRRGVLIASYVGDDAYPEMGDVTFPRGENPSLRFYRCAAGIVVEDGTILGIFPDMATAAACIRAEVDAEEAEAIAAIPERLGVDLSGLFGDGAA